MSKRKESPHWMPLYIEQFLADTANLTPAQGWAYINMLCAMWRSDDGTLPNDQEALARVSRIGANNWPRVWKGIKSLFDIDRDLVASTHLQAELGKANAKIAVKRAAGALGGITTQLRKSWARSASAPALTKTLNAPKPLENNDGAQASAEASAKHKDNRYTKEEAEKSASGSNFT